MGCGGGGMAWTRRSTSRTRAGARCSASSFSARCPAWTKSRSIAHPLGQRIYENVSKEAWKLWLEHMKMIMNEYRLNLGTQEAQEFLLKQMEDYFFGEGSAFPPGYQPPRAKT